jgi:uncharacterized Zn finger protein (UPF0148 family)
MMAVYTNPICPKCGKSHFGIREIDVQDANFRHFAIICTSCGCIVSTETMQDDDRQAKLESALNNISNQLKGIVSALQRHGIY